MKTKLPGVAATLSAMCVLLLVPFLGVSAAQWRTTSARVETVREVDTSVERLSVWLRMLAAMSDELLAVAWTHGKTDISERIPIAAPLVRDLAVGEPFDDVSRTLDSLVEQANDPTFAALVAEARSSALQPGTSLDEVAPIYVDVRSYAFEQIEAELFAINFGAPATGDEGVLRETLIAEAVSDLQTALLSMDTMWAIIVSAEFFDPVTSDAESFIFSLNDFQAHAETLDQLLVSGSSVDVEWRGLETSTAFEELMADYERLAADLAEGGLDSFRPADADAEFDVVAAFELAQAVSANVEKANAVDERLDRVLASSLDQLQAETTAAVEQAGADRSVAIAWLAAAAALFVAAVLGVVALVGRPLRKMADAANLLSEGELDTRLTERGPREIRIGSRALNQALASLQITEQQAVALAEERLTDPILDERTPGNLGASLQTAVERLAASIAERDRVSGELEYEASHDGLTKLSNRRAVLSHLTAALARTERNATEVALLFVDLDDFKDVNDEHGHHIGDRVLQIAADRLHAAARAGDTVGRIGGDEFVIVAEPVDGIDDAVGLSERVLLELQRPVDIEGVSLPLKASVGIALSNRGLTADELLRDADIAVYRAKADGKAQIRICDDELRAEIEQRAELEGSLRTAIDRDELVLHFQPTVSTTDGNKTASVEALIRWNHPTDGFRSPGTFIPTAELSDLILDIDDWALNAAGAQLREWRSDALTSGLSIAVNISARHLGRGTLAAIVERVIRQHEFDPHLLVIEVTETAIVERLEDAAGELEAIRHLGVRIALDDFGTGFMSLTHLRMLPVDIIKVDQAFVADLDDDETRSLVRLIIDTGRVLGMKVTVEGIESRAQADTVTALGADTLQGYYFGRPVPASDLRHTLEGTATSVVSGT